MKRFHAPPATKANETGASAVASDRYRRDVSRDVSRGFPAGWASRPENPLQTQADARIRTGDPFIASPSLQGFLALQSDFICLEIGSNHVIFAELATSLGTRSAVRRAPEMLGQPLHLLLPPSSG
jgi:hypothetical protein